MTDLMLDIETLGTGTRGLITQIGACYFDRYTGEIGDKFCENIRIQDSLNNNFEVDEGAIKFWLEQDKKIIKLMLKDAQDIRKVLEHFKQFYKKGTMAWSHATFDFPILTNAYHLLKIRQPIPYKKMRDIRTLVDLSRIKRNKNYKEITCVRCEAIAKDLFLNPKNHKLLKKFLEGKIDIDCPDCKGTGKIKIKVPKTHNALDDCIYQVGYCVEAFNKLRNNNA